MRSNVSAAFQGITAPETVGMIEGRHAVPVRHWHAKGYQISIISSLFMALAIGIFFIGMTGWVPLPSWQARADLAVTWILLTYIWVQMGSLILVGAGTKNQMWIDALTSIVPLFVIVYVIMQHYAGFIVISPFQINTAWLVGYTMLLDVVIDLGVSVMLSRQVVEFGGGGVV
jgi:hypothetical protein